MRRLAARALEEAGMCVARVFIIALWTAEGVRRAVKAGSL